jgi:hypothetical protein
MRSVSLLIALLGLAGCAGDIPHTATFKNPVTNATASCGAGPLADVNPWSKFDMCVENLKAEGWIAQK